MVVGCTNMPARVLCGRKALETMLLALRNQSLERVECYSVGRYFPAGTWVLESQSEEGYYLFGPRSSHLSFIVFTVKMGADIIPT